MIEQAKAIQTSFDGRFFRSRAEARWATFFKALELPYEYEKEGFALRSGWYLPDFWLPYQNCWIEVKGAKPTATEIRKAEELAAHTGKMVYIFGAPEMQSENVLEPKYTAYAMRPVIENGETKGVDTDDGYCWCECEDCGLFGIAYHGWSERLSCHCSLILKHTNFASPKLQGAYRSALSARFEHGQSGA